MTDDASSLFDPAVASRQRRERFWLTLMQSGDDDKLTVTETGDGTLDPSTGGSASPSGNEALTSFISRVTIDTGDTDGVY
ncbi:hypothetical protein HBB16_17540 [Pseudonocardia sp. MCCB 268]|nr:hypothetical protein [Pseudonocardia cytotoxica]